MPLFFKFKKKGKMKIKQLFVAVVIVIAAMVGTACKKDSSVAPTKNYQIIKLTTIDSTALSGGGEGPKTPPHNP
jgi:hypothetical protein